MKNRILSFVIFAAFILMSACHKTDISEEVKAEKTSESPNVNKLKSFFEKVVQKDQIVNRQVSNTIRNVATKGSKKKTSEPFLNRMLQISNSINWNNSFNVAIENENFHFVAFNEPIKPFQNKDFEFIRFLVLKETKNSEYQISVIEILGDKGTSLGKIPKDICIQAFRNKILNQNSSIESINASVIFFDENYQRDTSFRIENGGWKSSRISFRSDLPIQL